MASSFNKTNNHFRYFEAFRERWQGFETYARICMGLGTYHLLQTLTYYSI